MDEMRCGHRLHSEKKQDISYLIDNVEPQKSVKMHQVAQKMPSARRRRNRSQ